MTYYETGSGARVFAAGALNFTASITDPAVSRLVDNVWSRLGALGQYSKKPRPVLRPRWPSRCISSSRSGGAIRSSPSAP